MVPKRLNPKKDEKGNELKKKRWKMERLLTTL